ncbi:MAG: NEL-type E3 ubiquitin ligase domain-containing protein, partial [Candidatus Rhabdochlamydia sp.]
ENRILDFFNCQKKTDLNLSNLGLHSLPDIFNNLSFRLTKLNLDGNSLEDLPLSIINLSALKQLNIHNKKFITFADIIGYLSVLFEKKLLDAHLKNWKEEALPEENREEAINRIVIFFKTEEKDSLDLSNLDLCSLPDIFNYPRFVYKLKKLHLSNNQLTSLPESLGNLKALQQLKLNFNQFTNFPEFLRNLQTLTILDLSFNRITNFPEFLGNLQTLTLLDLSSNRFTILSESLGNLQALTILNLSFNRLTSLPRSFENLQSLVHLHLEDNQLTNLPELLCNLQALRFLDLSSNQLIELSDSLANMQSLSSLSLSNNPTLLGLPIQILDLSRTCTIDLTGCNLSQRVLETMQGITDDPTYTGPHISFSISDRTHREEKSIEESLKDLYRLVNKPPMEFSNLEKTSTLCSWLNRLSYIADYQKQGSSFINKIIGYLNQANECPDYRKIFYTIIQDAAETCGDRMALSVLHLGIAYKLATIDLKDTKILANFLKGVWALDLLEEIARNKIPTLPFFDEIEVYLGYPIKLKEELNLPIDVQEMLHFRCSALKNEDLQEARDLVLSTQTNQEAYFTFLIGHDKWKEALKHNYPIEFKTAEENRDTSLENSEDYMAIKKNLHQELIELTNKALIS